MFVTCRVSDFTFINEVYIYRVRRWKIKNPLNVKADQLNDKFMAQKCLSII